jgi:S-adenosylmethionine decarboxylase
MLEKNSILGLHILLTLKSENTNNLLDYNRYNLFINELLKEYNLEKVGESYFIFDNKSYTTAICLKESHICIHTWPEINRITLDIYLCNYSGDNTEKVRSISNNMVDFFEAEVISSNEIYR